MSGRHLNFTADNRPLFTSELPENVTAGLLALHGAALRLRNKFRLMTSNTINGAPVDQAFKKRVLYNCGNALEAKTDLGQGTVSMGLEELLVRRQQGLLKKQYSPEDVVAAHPFIKPSDLNRDQARLVFHPAVDLSSIPGAYCNIIITSGAGFNKPFRCEYLKPTTGLIELQSDELDMSISLNRDDCQVYSSLKAGELRMDFDRGRVWALNIIQGHTCDRFVNHQVAINQFGDQGVAAINVDGSLKLADCSRVLAPRFAGQLFKATDALDATAKLVEAAKESLKLCFDEARALRQENPRYLARGRLSLVKE